MIIDIAFCKVPTVCDGTVCICLLALMRAESDDKGSHARTRHFRVTLTFTHFSDNAVCSLHNTLEIVGDCWK